MSPAGPNAIWRKGAEILAHSIALVGYTGERGQDAAQLHSCSQKHFFFLLSRADIKCMLICCLIHRLLVPGQVLPFVNWETHKTGPRSISSGSCISF